MNQSIIHFKGINGLRAFAAIVVVISHIQLWFNLSENISQLAGFGVTIFFSISGFLITYLLIKEKDNSQIKIKHFYIRRIFRIWPLYYAYLILAVLVSLIYFSNSIQFNVFFYFFMLANIPSILNYSIPLLSHYWSLAIEEQFYIFWPYIISKSKNLIKSINLFILIFILIKLFFWILYKKWGYATLYIFISAARFDCMAIGALGACFYYHKIAFKFIFNRIVQIISWLIFTLLLINRFHIVSFFDHEIVAIVTIILIFNVSSNTKTIINLDNIIFDYLGKISYSIYVIHPLLILLILKIIPRFKNSTIYILSVYFSVFALTLIIASLSYRYFEKPFILLKKNYTTVYSALSKIE